MDKWVLSKLNTLIKTIDKGLSEYNIYHTPNFVYLKGNGVISLGSKEIELALLEQGLGISGGDIERIQMLKSAEINRIITIETYDKLNLTEKGYIKEKVKIKNND